MPDNNISKAQPSKAKGLGGVFPLRSKNAALLYMYRCKNKSNDDVFHIVTLHLDL